MVDVQEQPEMAILEQGVPATRYTTWFGAYSEGRRRRRGSGDRRGGEPRKNRDRWERPLISPEHSLAIEHGSRFEPKVVQEVRNSLFNRYISRLFILFQDEHVFEESTDITPSTAPAIIDESMEYLHNCSVLPPGCPNLGY